ncbi:MAG: hypothetical protein M0T84_11515 [Betaproteobacteria bacterium]|nr:hypothetical protein [Betaproteobacteria bacterium]
MSARAPEPVAPPVLEAVAALKSYRPVGHSLVVVFGVGSHGDVLQITPLLAKLREKFSSSTVVLIHESGLAEQLLRGSSSVDGVICLSARYHRALRGHAEIGALIDLIVECRYVVTYELTPRGTMGLSDDERRFVYIAQRAQAQWLPFLGRFPLDNDQLWRHAAEQGYSLYTLMAATAGFSDDGFEDFQVSLDPTDFHKSEALPRDYITISNAAETLPLHEGGWTKCLPRAKIERIVKRLKALGHPLVQLGVQADPPIRGVDIDLRGKTSVREAAAILKGAMLNVGPEGGIVNLARAVGTPSIVFFGSTPAAFFALGANTNVLPKRCGACWFATPRYLHQCPRLMLTPECTESVSEDEIVRAAQVLAAQRSSSPWQCVMASTVSMRLGARVLTDAAGSPPLARARRDLVAALTAQGVGSDVQDHVFRWRRAAMWGQSIRQIATLLPIDAESISVIDQKPISSPAGYDVSAKAVEEGHPNVRFFQSNDPRAATGAFDLAIVMLPQPFYVMRDLARILAIGGKALFILQLEADSRGFIDPSKPTEPILLDPLAIMENFLGMPLCDAAGMPHFAQAEWSAEKGNAIILFGILLERRDLGKRWGNLQ